MVIMDNEGWVQKGRTDRARWTDKGKIDRDKQTDRQTDRLMDTMGHARVRKLKPRIWKLTGAQIRKLEPRIRKLRFGN